MSFDWGTVLVSGGGAGVLGTAITAFVSRRKIGADIGRTEADAVSVLSKAAADLVEPLSRRIHELEDEVKTLRTAVAAAVVELDSCRARERDLRIALRSRDDRV